MRLDSNGRSSAPCLRGAGHAVVADERIGGDEDLALVRGVRQRLDVPGHAGVEHDFAEHRAGFAERGTFHLRAVLEDELHARGLRWHRGDLVWIFSDLDGLGCLVCCPVI